MARAPATTPGNALALLTRSQRIILAVAIGLSVLAGILTFTHANAVLIFVLAGAALAFLASVVGEATDQLGSRLSPGATGVLQSTIGNLPELFVAIFALQQGLLVVVQTSLIGSILGNSLLVLGLAFVVGGLRHGTQKFAIAAATHDRHTDAARRRARSSSRRSRFCCILRPAVMRRR